MDAPLDTKDEFSAPTAELAECAKINFENVERMNPGLARHPIYMLAKKQLDAVCARLSADEKHSLTVEERRGR